MSENALVKYELKDKMQLASALAQSGRFATDTTAPQALVKIQAGEELGIPPVQSMTNIHIVQGRVTLGATVMAALIQNSGKFNYKVKKLDNTECTLEFTENGEIIGESTFTMEDAKTAGLTGKDVWKKFPRNMLFSRALSNGARWYTPGIFGGPIYTPEELESGDVPLETSPTVKEVSVDMSLKGLLKSLTEEFDLPGEGDALRILKEVGVSNYSHDMYWTCKEKVRQHLKTEEGNFTE